MKLFKLHFFIIITLFTSPPLFSDSLNIQDMKNSLKKSPENIELRQKLGLYYLENQNYKECIDVFAAYSEKMKKKYQLILSRCYLEEKKFKEQSVILKSIIDNNGDTYIVRYQLGRAEYELKNLKEAIIHLKKSISMNKKYKHSYDLLIQVFMEDKNNYEARLLIQESLKMFGKSAKLNVQLCHIFSQENYLEETVKKCEEALKTGQQTIKTYIHLAIAYKDLEDLASAKKTLLRSIKRFPKEFQGFESLGYYYLGKKNYPIASKYFKKAISLNDQAKDSHLGLAQSSFELKEFETTLKALETACVENADAYTVIRNYTAQLRTKKVHDWMYKFEQASQRCRYLSYKKVK